MSGLFCFNRSKSLFAQHSASSSFVALARRLSSSAEVNAAAVKSSSNWSSIRIPYREYIEIKGDDTLTFLQGLCTNDTSKLKKHGDCIPAAFLNPKGRIIGDGLIYYAPIENSHRVIIESNNLICPSIHRYLGMYKLKSKIKMTYPVNLSTELVVSEKHHTEIFERYKDNIVVTSKDPRSSTLGNLIVHTSEVINSNKQTKAEKDLHRLQYDRFRMFHGVAEGSELIDRIPIECNLDLLNYISFTKGCYVGQELTARTKFKGIVRKRIFPFVTLPDANNLTPSSRQFSEIPKDVLLQISTSQDCAASIIPHLTTSAKVFISKEDSKNVDNAVGEIVSVSLSQDVGLVMLKLENVIGRWYNEKQGDSFVVNIENGTNHSSIRVMRPQWWVDIDPVTGKPLIE